MISKEDLASRLHGRNYRGEITSADALEAKAAGLVVVFGYSDDGVELRGAADDELGAGNGTEILFTAAGLLKNDCQEDDCPYFKQLQQLATKIVCRWGFDGTSWSYKTNIPHATFDIVEDGDVFCRGIVFALNDVVPGQRI